MQTGKPITTEEAPLLVDAAVALLTADRWLRLTMTTANGRVYYWDNLDFEIANNCTEGDNFLVVEMSK